MGAHEWKGETKRTALKSWQELTAILLGYQIHDDTLILHFNKGILEVPKESINPENLLGKRVSVLRTDSPKKYFVRTEERSEIEYSPLIHVKDTGQRDAKMQIYYF